MECTYLNSNSTGAVPRGLFEALTDHAVEMLAWRDQQWESWLPLLDRYHASLERLLGAVAGTVVSDASIGVLLSRVLSSFDFHQGRPRVVITNRDVPSAAAWRRALRRYGADLVVVDVDVDDPEAALVAALDHRVSALVVSHGSFETGALLDLARLQWACRDQGAVFIVDVDQTIGSVPLDVRALGIDVLLGGASRWLCGSTDIAFLYVRPDLSLRLEPALTGWAASDAPFARRLDQAPAAFAGGTPLVLPARVSQVALDLLLDVGIDAIREHSLRVTDRVIAHAVKGGIQVASPRVHERRGGFVTLRFADDEAACARLVHLGYVCSYRSGVRVAPHVYNTLDEADAFFAALHDVRRKVA